MYGVACLCRGDYGVPGLTAAFFPEKIHDAVGHENGNDNEEGAVDDPGT